MLKHVNISKGLGELENMALINRIDKLNVKWDIITDFAEIFDDTKEIPEKEINRKAFIIWAHMETGSFY